MTDEELKALKKSIERVKKLDLYKEKRKENQMLKINKEKRMADKIKKLLNKRGFIVQESYSKNSKSVYLRIDNGACNGIRISDHKNSRTNYKFNMIRNYRGKRSEVTNGKTKIFYNFNSIARLITDVEIDRSNKIINFGYSNYKRIRDRKNIGTYLDVNKQAA